MVFTSRWSWTLVIVLGMAAAAAAQVDDRPAPLVRLQRPTKAERSARAARELYALGMLCQRQDRLLEALKLFEQARALDPAAAAPHRALIPIYLALGRTDAALAASKRTLELTPQDHDVWFVYARQLKELRQTREAIAALEQGVACPGAREQLEILVQIYFDLGNLYEGAGDYARAEKAFLEVIKVLVDKRETLLDAGPFDPQELDQETAKTYEHIGQVCVLAKKYDRAVSAFTKAQKCDPARAGRLSFNLAQISLAQARFDEALRYLDEYVNTQPQGDQAYELKIDLLKRLGRENEILPSLEQAAARDSHNISLRLLVARQYARARKWSEAEQSYRQLAEENPSPEVYRGLFNLYRGQGAPVKVLDLLDRTLKAAAPKEDAPGVLPGDAAKVAAAAARARAMLPVLRDDPELVKALLGEVENELRRGRVRHHDTMRFLALLAARTRQAHVAEQLFRACLPQVTPQTEAEVYSGLLDVLLQQRKFQEVVAIGRQGLKTAQASNLIGFHIKLAPALVRLGRTNEALAAADEAVKLADANRLLILLRVRIEVLRQAQRYDEAIKECTELLKTHARASELRDIRYSLSTLYSSAHQHDQAEEQLRLILEADPSDATAHNDLGYIMADRGKNLEEAEQLIRKAIELDLGEKKRGQAVGSDGAEANAAYIDSLGWVLFRRNQLEEAKVQLGKAASLAGGDDDPVVWDHLGDVYFRLNEPARARSAWEKALQLYDLERRPKLDERYKELKHKLQELK